jgi:hypothetical protein
MYKTLKSTLFLDFASLCLGASSWPPQVVVRVLCSLWAGSMLILQSFLPNFHLVRFLLDVQVSAYLLA